LDVAKGEAERGHACHNLRHENDLLNAGHVREFPASVHSHQQKPRRSGVCVFPTQLPRRNSTIDTIRAAQCTASLFDAAPVFFGNVSSSTPSLYLAWAVAWS